MHKPLKYGVFRHQKLFLFTFSASLCIFSQYTCHDPVWFRFPEKPQNCIFFYNRAFPRYSAYPGIFQTLLLRHRKILDIRMLWDKCIIQTLLLWHSLFRLYPRITSSFFTVIIYSRTDLYRSGHFPVRVRKRLSGTPFCK